MALPHEKARALARLENETPIPTDGAALFKIRQEAGAILSEAKGRAPASSELLGTTIDEVGRSYYEYLRRRSLRRAVGRGLLRSM